MSQYSSSSCLYSRLGVCFGVLPAWAPRIGGNRCIVVMQPSDPQPIMLAIVSPLARPVAAAAVAAAMLLAQLRDPALGSYRN